MSVSPRKERTVEWQSFGRWGYCLSGSLSPHNSSLFFISEDAEMNRATPHIAIPGLKTILPKGFSCKNDG